MQSDERGVRLAPDAPQWRVLTLATAASSSRAGPYIAHAPVSLVSERRVALHAPIPAVVDRVMVTVGALVRAGQPLLSLKPVGRAPAVLAAPFAGTVVALAAAAGEGASAADTDPLVVLADLDEVEVTLAMPRAERARLGARPTIVVTPGLGAARAAVLQAEAPSADATTVRVRFDNRDRAVRPGALVQVSVEGPPIPVVQVPLGAVARHKGQFVVFVDRGGGRLDATPVELGRETDDNVEVVRGLHAGDRFVSDGALLLAAQMSLTSSH